LPSGDRVLAGAGLPQLALELGDVAFIALQRIVDDLDFLAQAFAHVGGLLALDQGGLGEVLAFFRQRKLGFFGPALLELVEA